MRRDRIALLVAAALVILLVAWIAGRLEPEVVEVRIPASVEARRNPYLLLMRALEALGAKTHVLYALSALPEADDGVVLWLTTRPGEERVATLRDWVVAGGQLIVVGDAAPAELLFWQAPVAEPGGDDDEGVDDSDQGEEGGDEPGDEGDNGDDDDEIGETGETGEAGAIGASGETVETVASGQGWSDAAERAFGPEAPSPTPDAASVTAFDGPEAASGTTAPPAADGAGGDVARIAVGGGSHVAIRAPGGWRNDALAGAAVAALWRELGAQAGTEVWLVIRPEAMPLWLLVWQRFAAALTSLALLFAAWLWRAGATLGPVQSRAFAPRRSLREHLLASGTLLWRSGQGDALVTRSRMRLEQTIRARFPELRDVVGPARTARLSAATDLSPELLGDALDRRPAGDPSALIAIMAAQCRLRWALFGRPGPVEETR